MNRACTLLAAALVIMSSCCRAEEPKPAAAQDPLRPLPVLPKRVLAPTAQPPFDPKEGIALDPAVRCVPKQRVVLDGVIQIDKGPSDGLEVLACLREGKTHEALVRLTVADGRLVNAAMLLAFNPPAGRPAGENSGVPARGTPMRLTLMWRDEDGAWVTVDAAEMVRDRVTDRAYPALPWIYTGSRTLMIAETGPDGKPVRRERFMLDSTRSVAVNYDEPDALLASPFPCANQDARFEVNSAITPPQKTPVHLVITPAETVFELQLAADATLAHDGAVLDDAALGGALAGAFGGSAKPAHRAVTVRLPTAVSDEQMVAARKRILTVAAAAKAWCVPVFVPAAASAQP